MSYNSDLKIYLDQTFLNENEISYLTSDEFVDLGVHVVPYMPGATPMPWHLLVGPSSYPRGYQGRRHGGIYASQGTLWLSYPKFMVESGYIVPEPIRLACQLFEAKVSQ